MRNSEQPSTVFQYRTLAKASSGNYKAMGSKFLCFLYPVKDEAQIKDELQALRKKYYDATHHCFAWFLAEDASLFRASDDGEPAHTAGTPILNTLRSASLTMVLAVVIRYYGGTKLGTSGLIQAYKSATQNAIDHAEIITVMLSKSYILTLTFSDLNQLIRTIERLKGEIVRLETTTDCLVHFCLPMVQTDAFEQSEFYQNLLNRTR